MGEILWVRLVRGGMVREGCMCSLCQMPSVNKQGALRGAPSGVLTHPSRRTQSGCPLPSPYLEYRVRRSEERERRRSGLYVPGADTEELWV